MYSQTTSSTITTTISGNNILFSFTATQASTYYYFMLNTNVGNAYSNSFSIQVVQCSPSTNLNSVYSVSVTSITSPISVFIPTSSDTYPSYCSLKYYTLYDSSTNDVSSTTTPFSFSKTTG